MKKKIITLIIGLLIFIPSIKAQDVTKEAFEKGLEKNISAFNTESKDLMTMINALLLLLQNEELPEDFEVKDIEITSNEDDIIISSKNFKTTSTFNQENQQITLIHDEIDENNIETVLYALMHESLIKATAIELKGYDLEIVNGYLEQEEIEGITEYEDGTIIIELDKLNIPESEYTPKVLIEKIDNEHYNISAELENGTGEEMIYIFKSENGQEFKQLVGISGGGTITDTIDPNKEYSYKAVVKGYSNYGETVSIKKVVPEENKKPTTTVSKPTNTETKEPTKPTATKEPVKTSTTTENPKTGIKSYSIIGITAILTLGTIYKISKRKMSQI